MKTLTVTGIFLMLFEMLNAQVSLDHTYNYSTTVIKFETLGYKYFLMDVPNSQCRIYNLDHSFYKTINCSVPNGFFLADVKYISENLFDSDSGLELVYTYYKYVPTQDSYYYEYDSKIINEDGSQIQEIDGGRFIYILQTEESIYKLFAYCYDYSVFPEKVWTQIYSLPESAVFSAFLDENKPEILMDAFPNPATQSLKVAYTLPENVSQGTLHLVNNSGRQVDQFIIDNHIDHLTIDVTAFQSGVYHYFIEYGNTRTPSKKLVVK